MWYRRFFVLLSASMLFGLTACEAPTDALVDELTPTPPAFSTAGSSALFYDNFDTENGGVPVGYGQYKSLQNWDITRGSIDLLGNGYFDCYPGNGLYLDMDGAYTAAARLESKQTLTLEPGRYRLRLRVGNCSAQENTMEVSFGTRVLGSVSRTSKGPLEWVDFDFTVSASESGKIVLDHAGADNTGLFLDVVELSKAHLYDNFDTENGGVPVGYGQYKSLQNWDITRGSIDLLGNGYFDCYPGNGLYLDMDGAYTAAARLESKQTLTLEPGTYRVRLHVGSCTAQENTMTVSIGTRVLGSVSRTSKGPLEWVDFDFTVSASESGKIVLDHAGADNSGLLLNVVEFWNKSAPIAKLASASYTGIEGAGITFDGSVSTDPDGDALSYAWDFGDGTTGTGAKPSHAYADNGTYTVTLTVTEASGARSQPVTAQVTVSNANPSARLGAPSSVDEGSSIALSLTSASDPSSADVAAGFGYAFDCGTGAGYESSTSNQASCPTTDNGSRTVRGKITDKDGGFTEYTASVTIRNVPPAVNAGPDVTIRPASLWTLNATFTDPGQDTWTCTIDWNDGFIDTVAGCTPSTGISGTHAFKVGTYYVKVTATDKDGGIHTDEVIVTVSGSGSTSPARP